MLLERALEAADLLVTEGKIVGDRGRSAELHLLADVVRERIEGLRRRVGGTREIGIALALRYVLSAGEGQGRHLGLREIIEGGEQLERGERPQDDIDLLALDQLLRLGFSASGASAGVADQQLDFASGQSEVLFLQEGRDALLRMHSAGGQRPSLDRK